MNFKTDRQTVMLATILVLSGVFFGIDLLLPLGIAGGILYVPVVLLTLWLSGHRVTLGFALAGSLLVGIGFFWSPAGDSLAKILTNRFLSIAGIWLAALVVLLYKKNQQALRKSEATNQLILDTMAEGIISFTPDGRVESINLAAERMFGYEQEEICGQPVDKLFPRLTRTRVPEFTNGVDASVTDDSTSNPRTEESFGYRKDGTVFPIRISVTTARLPTDTLVTAVVQDVTDRRRLERKLIGVPEEERQQIGHDLHEEVGQILNGIKLLAENLVDHLQDRDPRSAQSARRICDGLTEADDQIGELIYQLIPVNLTANELAGALEHMIEMIPETADLHCRVHATGEHPVRDNTVITHLYHIAREAATNAIEHGEASSLRIHLHQGTDEIRLEIEDDGKGIASGPESAKGMGLRVMEYRAHIIGATLHVDSAPDEGTRIRCILPERPVVTKDM